MAGNNRSMRSSVDQSGSKMNPFYGSVVCPRPRRVGILAHNVIRPRIRLHLSQSGVADVCDSEAVEDLLDIFRIKEESVLFVASSPPFFLGSPPSRTSNPLAKDARFVDEKLNPSLSPFLPSPSLVKGGVCSRLKPASVRIEGFDCENSSISAMA